MVVGLGILGDEILSVSLAGDPSLEDFDKKLIEKEDVFGFCGDRIPESFESSPDEASE